MQKHVGLLLIKRNLYLFHPLQDIVFLLLSNLYHSKGFFGDYEKIESEKYAYISRSESWFFTAL